VGRDAQIVELGEDELGNPVVQHAFAVDHFVAGAVAGGGVVLEILNQSARLGTLEQDLGLALIDFASTVHLESVAIERWVDWAASCARTGQESKAFPVEQAARGTASQPWARR